MDGATVWLAIGSRMANGDNTERGRVVVNLYDCAGDGTGCVPVASGSPLRQPWAAGSGFVMDTIALGEVTHTWAPGRLLRAAITVGADAEADIEFAFDTADYPSRLEQRFL